MNRLATVERKLTKLRDSFAVIDGLGMGVDELVGGVCES